MKIKQFQIDAFTDRVFGGNPAAVCPLQSWAEDNLLQSIAEENNLSETAFFVPAGNNFELRWFTPVTEVDLCGHATLAAAHVIFEHIGYQADCVIFKTRSGDLTVRKNGNMLEMDFPLYTPKPGIMPEYLAEGLGKTPVMVLRRRITLPYTTVRKPFALLFPTRHCLTGLACVACPLPPQAITLTSSVVFLRPNSVSMRIPYAVHLIANLPLTGQTG